MAAYQAASGLTWGGMVESSLSLPAGLPLDAASWAQTPLVVRQLVVHLLDVLRQQQAQITTLEARIEASEARLQNSRNSDRPPSSDPPFVKKPSSATTKGAPGAKWGHHGYCQALLKPTAVMEIRPEAWPCGQRDFPETTPYYIRIR